MRIGANPRTEPTTSQRLYRPERPPAKKSGASHRHDYRLALSAGIEPEITDCRTLGLARLFAIDYQRSRGSELG
jgi:hypothetical protein